MYKAVVIYYTYKSQNVPSTDGNVFKNLQMLR